MKDEDRDMLEVARAASERAAATLMSGGRDLQDSRTYVVRRGEGVPLPAVGPTAVARAARQQLAQAMEAVRDLVHDMKEFEDSLDENEEVQVVIVSGPGGTRVFLHSIMPVGADRIRYTGLDQEGERVTVIQHITQLNVMLRATKVAPLMPRRMTFEVVGDSEV